LTGYGATTAGNSPDGDDQLYGGTGNDTYLFDLSYYFDSAAIPSLHFIPLATDTVYESPNQGFVDTLLGLGVSGVDVDLHTAAPQHYWASQLQDEAHLILTLFLKDPLQPDQPGEVESAF